MLVLSEGCQSLHYQAVNATTCGSCTAIGPSTQHKSWYRILAKYQIWWWLQRGCRRLLNMSTTSAWAPLSSCVWTKQRAKVSRFLVNTAKPTSKKPMPSKASPASSTSSYRNNLMLFNLFASTSWVLQLAVFFSHIVVPWDSQPYNLLQLQHLCDANGHRAVYNRHLRTSMTDAWLVCRAQSACTAVPTLHHINVYLWLSHHELSQWSAEAALSSVVVSWGGVLCGSRHWKIAGFRWSQCSCRTCHVGCEGLLDLWRYVVTCKVHYHSQCAESTITDKGKRTSG